MSDYECKKASEQYFMFHLNAIRIIAFFLYHSYIVTVNSAANLHRSVFQMSEAMW